MGVVSPDLPEWLEPVREGAATIDPRTLSRFDPPADANPRQSAVLILFGEGEDGPDLLLTERSHTMRSHPGQVSFPGGGIDPGETPTQAAIREAWEETGLDRSGVEVFAELPKLWLPPSNNHVTPMVGHWRTPSPVHAVDPAEVHAVYRVSIRHLVDPANRYMVKHPSGLVGPGFWVGPENDVMLWGFTGGVVNALLEHVGWSRPWDTDVHVDLPERLVWRARLEGQR
jgi:8-oxo-dGTP pyrophosphatase MutT (NUDIX family)